MIIAIDYDNTITKDVMFWRAFIVLVNSSHHKIICVTSRSDEGEFGAEVRRVAGTQLGLQIVFAGNEWKREAAKKAGYEVDVWIDDTPEYIAKQQLILLEGKGVK